MQAQERAKTVAVAKTTHKFIVYCHARFLLFYRTANLLLSV